MDGGGGGGGGTGRKRRRPTPTPASPSLFDPFNESTFPLLLAAAANLRQPRLRSLIKRSLRSHLRLLLTATDAASPLLLHHVLPRGLLSLLPFLLTSRFSTVSELSAEVVGAAALSSLEANAIVASDGAIMEGLVRALGSRSRRSAEAACHAVMDISTSPVGRDCLSSAFALEKLLYLLCHVATTSSESFFLKSMEEVSNNHFIQGSAQNNLVALFLDAAVVLINTSAKDCLTRIPEELSKQFLPLLKELFDNIVSSTLPCNGSREQILLRSTKHDLAIAIFRLSMDRSHYTTWGYEEIEKSIFDHGESEFGKFLLTHWEESPCIIRRASHNSEDNTAIFSSLVDSFNLKSIDSSLNSILHGLISCPPIASDELDIFSFLDEVNMILGSRIMYGQDIRVLKTQKLATSSMQGHINKEVHFFKDNMGSGLIEVDYVEKCKEAFQDGYTIALRGLEFRFDKVASIAEGLAELFGQPSVGANMYITPPGSQGLAQHYDDHCVFVWQLFGRKNWRILPRATALLPRLYEPLGNTLGMESDEGEGMQFSLQEGDILYIPRGCPHDAHTPIDETKHQKEASATFSLHLTLGIEVEPPFEWEGFAHVALNCWNEKQKHAYALTGHKLRKRRVMFVNLLHIAIKLIADLDPVFRKACMVAAFPLSCNTEEGHYAHSLILNQKGTFCYIINRINTDCNFMEAFRSIETVLEKNDNSVQWMRWLRHLPQEEDEIEEVDYNHISGVLEDLVVQYSEHTEEATVEFSQMKSKFCKDVVYDDACESFRMLLEKYRKTRKQYMKGMLSLHSTY